jgi:hypothetical protein
MADGKISIEQWSKMSMPEKQQALRYTNMMNEREAQIKEIMGENKPLGIESRLGSLIDNKQSNTNSAQKDLQLREILNQLNPNMALAMGGAAPQTVNPAPQQNNILPIPQNEQGMPMFATDQEYMAYLKEYDPEMFMQMQNEYYNTRGTMGQGNPLKGLLDSIMGGN